MSAFEKYAAAQLLQRLQHKQQPSQVDPRSFGLGAGSATAGGAIGLLLAKLMNARSAAQPRVLPKYEHGPAPREFLSDLGQLAMHHLRKPPVIDI